MKKIRIALFVVLFLPFFALGQEDIVSENTFEPEVSVVKARVVEILDNVKSDVSFGEGRDVYTQTISAELLSGANKGSMITLAQDYLGMEKGDRFLVEEYVGEDGLEYTLIDLDRRTGLYILLGFFALIIILFSRWQGVRSLLSLAGSIFVILYVLIPLLLSGAPPILTSVLLATIILAIAIFFTHGFNKRSLIAFGGTVVTVFVTGIIASFAIQGTGLTGFGSDHSTYLNFNTEGQLDFVGLLLAGIMIGVLGVLDDIAITQVAIVRELYAVNKDISRLQVFRSALRVGREHISALVNTLVLAYAGVSLPLMLYVGTLGVSDATLLINSEIFATEIVRTIIGSIGLVLSVPLVTLLAVIFLEDTRGIALDEKEKHEGCAHGHGH